MATFATFVGLPVIISLGAASLTGAIASGIISTLTKTYQKKLKKVTKLIDIVTPALVVFERVISGAMKNGVINEEEFNTLQTLYLETLNELTGVNHRMEAENRSPVEKSLMEEINELKKIKEQAFNCLLSLLFRILLLKMDKIYYQHNNLWKGQKAVKKLAELSGEKPKTVKQWLSRQAFWQVHLQTLKRVDLITRLPPQMKCINLTCYTCLQIHYMVLSIYIYILAGIDTASRFKVARPLRTKQARDVAEMIADIYKVGPLTYPKIFQNDNGSEFKGDVTKMLEKNEVKIPRVTTKYKHTHAAFVEALNKIFTERLFKVQDAQELNDPEKVSASWVKHLYGLVEELNYKETEMIGMKPKDAIKLDEVPLVT